MRWILTTLCLLALGGAALAGEPASLTYVVGSGYILRQGDLGVAIDALVARDVPEETRALMARAEAPFDVDLVLVTHSDWDHFDAGIVSQNLSVNPRALLVGPADVVEAVRAVAPALAPTRCIVASPGPDSPQRIEGAGFTVEVFALPHPSGSPENVGYRLTLPGLILAHAGDLDVTTAASDFARTGFDRVTADVAIVPYFFFALFPGDVASCPSRLYVPTHAGPGELPLACRLARSTPYKILCFRRPLESAVLPATPKE
jgi:L-ascorbate metabolism protein UlaG (beta-lactamase superfamily)